MNKPLMAAMMASISDVLEIMFYLSIEINEYSEVENKNIFNEGNITGCKISFNGPVTGYILLYIPENLLSVMTENFMGIDKSEVTKKYQDGIICEVNNMVAGSIFKKYDNNQVYNLGIPEILPGDKIPDKLFENIEGVLVTETTNGFLIFKLILK